MMVFFRNIVLVAALMAWAPVLSASTGKAAADSGTMTTEAPADDSLMGMIQPWLEAVRPYLSPLEDFMRDQATAFRGFVKEVQAEIQSPDSHRGTPRVSIDLPPPSR